MNDISGSLTKVVVETVYYTRSDELLSMERGTEIWYYLYDGYGSTRLLTNEAGRITDEYSYNAYGNLLEKEGDTENEFLYTGEQYNANTGLYYLRARYMNPSTGTFISMDSYQGSIYDPVTLHKYLYANANPVMYTDPSGYMAFPTLAVGMTISEVFSASWRFIGYSSIVGAFAGAACGAIDSILGGNNFSQVVEDAFKGFGIGAFWGVVISTLACYAVINPICMMVLQGVQGFLLVSGMVSVYVSAKEGNISQSIFRALLAIFTYKGTGKLIKEANLRIAESNNAVTNTDFYATKDGVIIKGQIPNEYVENPYRDGSYGMYDEVTGKFREILRIDPATPKGKKGPSYSHYHINGGEEHFSPRPGDSNPLDY